MDPEAIVVREARPQEAPVIGALTEAAYRDGGHLDEGEWYAETLLDAASRIAEALVLVAEIDGQVVGAVTVCDPGRPWSEIAAPDETEVRMLAVASTARRRGVADRLMDAVETRARALGRAGVVLSTETSMVGAHALYERRAYVRQPHRDWGVEDVSLLVYRRAL